MSEHTNTRKSSNDSTFHGHQDWPEPAFTPATGLQTASFNDYSTRDRSKPSERETLIHRRPGDGNEKPTIADKTNDVGNASIPFQDSPIGAWLLECCCLLIAIACLVAIFKLLMDANGKRQDHWRVMIGLNSVVAILSTVFRSSVAQICGEVISQLKWHWIYHPKPLIHLQFFDDASRGPYGASLLAYRLRRLSFVQFACFVTVASYAISPFIQQAIRSELCQFALPSEHAHLPVARGQRLGNTSVSKYYAGPGGPIVAANLEMRTSVLAAIANPDLYRKSTSLVESCSTGNCTFPKSNGISHVSLGFCSLCSDVSSALKPELLGNTSTPEDEYRRHILSLPNGLILKEYEATVMNFSTGDNAFENLEIGTELSSVLDVAVARVSVIALSSAFCTYSTDRRIFWNCTNSPRFMPPSEWQSVNPIASACAIYPCMRNYSADVHGTVLQEDLVDTKPLSPTKEPKDVDPEDVGHFAYHYNESCVLETSGQDFSNATELKTFHNGTITAVIGSQTVLFPTQCLDFLDWWYLRGVKNMTREFFTGTCFTGSGEPGMYWVPPERRRAAPCSNSGNTSENGGSWWLEGLYNNGNATADTISSHMQVISDALTDRLRIDTYDQNAPETFVEGVIWETTVCTRLVWRWLLLPAGLLIVTAMALLVTILRGLLGRRNVPLWKGSILPLIYGTSEGLRETSSGLNVVAMEKAAKATDVTLKGDELEGTWLLDRGS